MSSTQKQGLIKKSSLNETEIAEIARLSALCNQQDNLHMRIPLEALSQRSGNEIDDFLYYEEEKLVGYLYVDSWGHEERELTGMVAPAFRRRGIFRQLFAAAEAECQTRKVESLILISEQSSKSGHAFAKMVKAHHDFSEHEMVLGTFLTRGRSDPEFQMYPATLNDKAAITSIIATDLPDEEDARQLVEDFYSTPDQRLYLATLDEQPLGCLRLDYRGETVGIYGFVVRPEHRKQGYGRQMLEYIIQRVYDEGPYTIMLEVETTNHHAISLYSSCGFSIKTTYDYFNRTIKM